MDRKERESRLHALLITAGINVTGVTILGAFAHIDTFKKYDLPLRSLLTKMGASQVNAARVDAKGRTLDGVKTYRLIAKFA